MKVLVDTSPLQTASADRGIGRYTRELVAALRALPSEHEILTLEDKPKQVDLVHYPFFDFFFATLPLIRRSKTVVTIHDTIPLIYPKHYVPGIKGTLRFWRQRLVLGTVNHIITDSANSRRDIHEYLGVPLDKITPVPLAASESLVRPTQAVIDAVRKTYELPKRYLLYVGDINYSKNLPFLLRVIKLVPHVTLVMVGKQVKNVNIPEGQLIEKTIKDLNIADRVIRLDQVKSEADLAALYSGATAYIQPSLYEGFGLPVLEAMQCKTPVICSLGGSLPEVAGDAAIFFHPHKEEDCAAAIRKLWRFTPTQINALVRKGVERAGEFSWKRTASETLAVYEKVAG